MLRSLWIALALVGLSSFAGQPTMGQGAANLPIEVVPGIGHIEVSSVAFSPDGRTLVSGSGKTVKLWDAATGRELRTLSGHAGAVAAVAFSPDGGTVVSGSADSTLKLWDAATGRQLRTFAGHKPFVRAVAFTPDGRTIVSGGSDNTIKLWDVASGRELRTLIGHREWVNAIALSRDGRTILSASGDKTVRLWDAVSGRALRTLGGHRQGVGTVAFSPDERTIISGSDELKLWDVRTARALRTFSSGTGPVAYSPDGRMIVSGTGVHNTIRVWDATSGRELRTLTGHVGYVVAVAFSSDGRTIASASQDKTIKLWDVESGRELKSLGGRRLQVWAAAFSPDGRTIASGGDDKTVKLWDAPSGRILHILAGHPDGRVNVVTFSPDGRTIVSGSTDGTLKLWDVASGREHRTLTGHAGSVWGVAFSPDSRTIVSGSYDKTIKIWDAASGRELRTLAGSAWNFGALSPDVRTIMTASEDLQIKLLDVASGREFRTVAPYYGVSVGAFSADGRTIATASQWQPLKVWDLASGRELSSLGIFDPQNWTWAVAFSPDGRTIVSGSTDHILKLWDVASGRELRSLVGHGGAVVAVGFSPDGRAIVSASLDTTVRRWSLAGELLATSIAAADGEWLTLTPEGFFDASERGAELLSVVRGFDVWSMDQFYQSLYRPDLVREKLAGDPRGLVREAAAKLDLTKVLASGNAPAVKIVSPGDGTRAAGEQIMADIEISERGGGIGRVEWRINGVTVGIETPSAPPAGQPLRLTRGLVFDDGENEIEVVVYNAQNRVASSPTRVTIAGQATTARTPARMFVLAVGLNDYAEAKFKLKSAVPDAKALAQALSEAGKGVYESVEVALVQDADVNRGKLDAVFADLAKKVRPSDVFVFFLAGHGKTIDGRYYFIPQDFRIEGTVTPAALESAVVKQGIAQEEWQVWLARVPARKSILLFDTCESGSLTGEGKETHALARGAANDRLVQATGRTVLTASSDDTDAIEGFRGHGLFTYNVLEALERADTDGNGRIEVAELAAYVYAQVTALSEQVYKQRQVPQVRITGNYSLAKPTPIFAGKEPGVVLPAKATHQVTSAAELLVLPAMGARRVRKLDAKMPVTLVKSDAGWTLVAREGRPLGFVATKDLVPLQ